MSVRKIIIILLAFSSIAAMEQPPKNTDIELKSSDNKTLTLPLAVAQQSPVIATVLKAFEEKRTKTVNFSHIKSDILRLVTKIMSLFYDHRDLKGKALLDKVSSDYNRMTRLFIPVNNRQTFALLRAFDFLEFLPGIQLLARQISTQPFMIDQVVQLIHKKQLGITTATEIGRIYYLITNKYLPDIDSNSFTFSLRDYLDYKPDIIKERGWHSVALDLKELQLKDLEGLQDIPYRNSLEALMLDKNNLSEIPDLALLGLNNLKLLYISHNHLTHLSESCFHGLNKLQALGLDFNELRQLPATIFANLTTLDTLSLQYNKLTELPSILFKDLINLKNLKLNNNKLTELPEKLFDNTSNLRELNLGYNELHTLPPLLFHNLRNLRNINFFNNEQLKIPLQLLQGLTNLQEVELRLTALSRDNIEELRKRFPAVTIPF